MKRPENTEWLDDALSEAIGSEKSKADFEKWKQTHPEAVEMLTSRARPGPSADVHPLKIGNIIMKSPITRLAAAAVIIVGVLIGINQFGGSIDGASVAWADVAERFESVPFFNMTNYVGWGPYEQDQKEMEIMKIEIWKSENSQIRLHSGEKVIFADFADGNNVVVAFDRSTMQPLNADQMAKVAKMSQGWISARQKFSLDTLLRTFSPDDTGITPVDTADTAASRETVLFEVKHKTTQCSIWALRKSKLPIRASFRDTKRQGVCRFAFQLFGKEGR